jgi:hypothetical protein
VVMGEPPVPSPVVKAAQAREIEVREELSAT